MANEIITSGHVRTTDLGCWESNGKPTNKGIVNVKVSIGGAVAKIYQVALIAYNRRDELEATLGRSNYDISHLCHNGKCFNPEHLIVDSGTNNQRRRICNGQKILIHDGFIADHPCPHGSVEKMRTCILPAEHGQDAVATSVERGASTEPTPAPDLDDELKARLGYGRLTIKELGVRPFLHQLAVIATSRGDELKTTLDRSSWPRRFDVSHLCHNGKCFNPEHLIVESTTNNLRRRSCNGQKVISYGNFTYHPCPHDGVEEMRKCILPTLRLEAGHHEYDSETSQGQTRHAFSRWYVSQCVKSLS
ncbi:zinc-binding loop region of homing endonuclease-domain-containing protein [Lipomyces starkeyi]